VLLDWLREDMHLEGGDDPLGGPIFPRFWTRGAAPDANRMKLAAASIMVVSNSTTDRAISILEPALKTAATERERQNIEIAVCAGYSLKQNFAAMLTASTALLQEIPESRFAYLMNVEALLGLERYDEAMKLADDRLKLLENDADALRSKTDIDTARGNYTEARGWLQKLADSGRQDAELLNESAWLALYTGHIDDKDIATGIKATQLSKDNPHILHTLACLYAEAGKTKEAHDLLLRSMDELNLDQPNDDYWFALGRIAEQYGERDVAIADYRRIEKPRLVRAVPTSSYELAQIRLKAMKAEKEPAAALQAVNRKSR
jgi:tetratricopeptide (TPR) repeat protein